MSQDEVDAFHDSRDTLLVSLRGDKGPSDSASDDEADVYSLDSAEGDSEEEDSDEEEDDEADAEEQDGNPRIRALERQEKLLRAEARRHRGEEESDDDDEEDEVAEDKAAWGARRKVYYGENEVEDEDEAENERNEAQEMQRRAAEAMTDADYGADYAGDLPDSEDEEAQPSEPAWQERIDRPAAATEAEAAAKAAAPELEALLQNLRGALSELRSRVGPLVKEVREGKLVTADGLSYLETKNLLLLQYSLHLLFYMLLRAEGRAAQDHPVISRLLEIKLYLERLRPLDKKLRPQMDKLMASHQMIQAASEGQSLHPALYRPDPGALVSEHAGDPKDGGAEPSGAYRPPKLKAVMMEDEPGRKRRRNEARAASEGARRSLRSDMIRDLAREVHDMPEEVRDARPGEESAQAGKQRRRLEKRAAEEEELMMRVPLGKKELRELKQAQRAQGGGATLDDFADDVADLVQAAGQAGTSSLSQKFGVDLTQAAKVAGASGDADLPLRMSLVDRRAKLDSARAKQLRGAVDGDVLMDDAALEEDVDYVDAAAKAQQRKAAKAAKYAAAPLPVPREDERVAGGHRKISSAVEKNRGLTPHRRKDTKNPRVKGRKKFAKASMRRKGQVASVRKPTGPYGGEATGIKTRVSKSTKF